MGTHKPQGLHTAAYTKDARAERAANDAAMRPPSDVFAARPPQLKGHGYAAATWDRLAGLYQSIEAEIVCDLDRDLLVDYCLISEQVVEIDALRQALLKRMKSKRKGDYVSVDEFAKLDSRADRKRDLLQKMRQALYLTPRARMAAAPKKKTAAPPPDPLEELLDGVELKGL